ncbi:Acyltransferase-like protein, chloroplastic [Ananas comosus]|uniref:Acyltransferase-like protein, chloroplastic n=1 Tax=Ananas comosus TaxID=4615 RepID=A0A199UPI6_ANACO|nr:Acyltransferase-like protein, chloroplastic [Ananas comosus]
MRPHNRAARSTRRLKLVTFVEDAVRLEHSNSPNKPIYLMAHSFGGCLALAIAARNPHIDIILVLSNPATSFGKSQVQPLLLIFKYFSNREDITVTYLLSLNFDDSHPSTKYYICRDNLLPSKVEAGRLQNLLANCKVHYFEDHGHNLLLEHGVHLPTLLKCSNMYRHSRKYDRISDFLPPTLTELRELDKATRTRCLQIFL